MDYSQEEIEKAVDRVDPVLQATITSETNGEIIKNISKQNGLTENQQLLLWDLTTYVMMGFLEPTQFVTTVSSKFSTI